MRTYSYYGGEFREVTTDAAGFNDEVWLTTLVQCLLLSPGESPFFADYGIPAQQTVLTQIFPDFYVNLTASQFAPRFASLIVTKLQSREPAYKIDAVSHQGSVILLEMQ